MNMYLQLTKKIKKKNINRKYNGGIAIILVISLSLIALLGGVALSISSIDYNLSTIGFTKKIDSKHLLYSCSEEALSTISSDYSFVGTKSVDINSNSCTYIVGINAIDSSIRDVRVSVLLGDYSDFNEFRVDITTNPITVIK